MVRVRAGKRFSEQAGSDDLGATAIYPYELFPSYKQWLSGRKECYRCTVKCIFFMCPFIL